MSSSTRSIRFRHSCAFSVLLLAVFVPRAASAAPGDEDEEIVVPANPRQPPQQQQQQQPPPAQPPAAVTPEPTAAERLAQWLEPYTITGYVQGELQSNQSSEDQLAQGGAPLNKDRFLLRRARVRLDGEYKYAALQLEIDGNTARAPQLRILHAFATLKLPGRNPGDPPLAAVTAGLFDTPFGFELGEWPRNRYFMERSTASQSFFPGEPDVGIKFHGGIAFVRWDVAAMNGEPLESRVGYPGVTPRSAKDIVFRVGVETKPRNDLGISGHVSALRGRGFHPGSDGTKSTIQWKDQNEDGTVQPSELTGVSATAATPSQTFERWVIGADAQLKLTTGLGQSTFAAEVMVAKNLDRGLFVADPVVTGVEARELGFYVGFVQEITRWGVAGFRFDHYDPNADFFDKRGGKLIPTSQTIQTFSPLVGLRLPDNGTGDRARLLFQYDFIRDNLARDERGLPTDLKNDLFTMRLQVNL